MLQNVKTAMNVILAYKRLTKVSDLIVEKIEKNEGVSVDLLAGYKMHRNELAKILNEIDRKKQ